MMHHNHFWWRFFPKKELTQVYACATLRSFAISLICLFIPLYLHFEQGYTLPETLYFYIFYSLIFAISTPIAAKFSARFGIKHSILVSVPLYLIFMALLYCLPIFKTPLIIIATILGLSLAFYWMGMHLVFRRASDGKHRGEEVGKREGLSILATLAGPLIGGFLIGSFGFKPVFILASVLLFLSVFFLFLGKEDHVKYHFSIRSLLDKRHWQNSLFFVSRGSRVMAAEVVWPLFIFVILNDYLSLGLVGSIMALISAILVWIIGKYSDQIDRRKIIRWVVGGESLSWFLRAVVSNVGQIFGVTIFGALTYGSLEAPVGALEYDKAKRNITQYFVTKEIFICLGRILILMFVLMTNSLSGGLVFQGIVNFAALLF